MSIRKLVITAALFVLGIRYGFNYLLSEKFQTFADQKKAPWTCQVNNAMAGFFQTSSEYQRAYDLYERTLARCPDTQMAEVALFQKAACMEDLYNPQGAMAVYQEYLQKYEEDKFKNSDRFRKANMAAERIRFSK